MCLECNFLIFMNIYEYLINIHNFLFNYKTHTQMLLIIIYKNFIFKFTNI
jgi:hypothetical protein